MAQTVTSSGQHHAALLLRANRRKTMANTEPKPVSSAVSLSLHFQDMALEALGRAAAAHRDNRFHDRDVALVEADAWRTAGNIALNWAPA
jgi:hypothetical protein